MISDGENGGSSPFKLSVISFINPNTFCCDNNKQYPKIAQVVVTIYILTLTTFKIFPGDFLELLTTILCGPAG